MPNEFRNLVFEGGGVKGLAYIGALAELERLKILSKIKRTAGTSAGAIIALLLSLGYSVKDIHDIMYNTDFKEFADDTSGIIIDIIRLISKFGWHKGNKFYMWISRAIEQKTGKKNITFKEFHKSKEDFKQLYIIGTNLSKKRYEVYSHETTPDMEVRKAVRRSMSIPIYFKAVFDKDDVFVDGGVVLNYPINIFDNKKYVENKKNAEKVRYNDTKGYVFNHETLGFRLDTRDEILHNKMGWSSSPATIRNIKDYTTTMINFMVEIVNKSHLHKNDWNRTVFIDTLGIKTTDFNMTKDKINSLINSGKYGVKNHFRWRNSKIGMKKPL